MKVWKKWKSLWGKKNSVTKFLQRCIRFYCGLVNMYFMFDLYYEMFMLCVRNLSCDSRKSRSYLSNHILELGVKRCLKDFYIIFSTGRNSQLWNWIQNSVTLKLTNSCIQQYYSWYVTILWVYRFVWSSFFIKSGQQIIVMLMMDTNYIIIIMYVCHWISFHLRDFDNVTRYSFKLWKSFIIS